MNEININTVKKPEDPITVGKSFYKNPDAVSVYIEKNEHQAGVLPETLSERMQKQSALNETINAVPADKSDVIIIADKNRNIKYLSMNAQKIFGWLPNELKGRKAEIYLHKDDLLRFKKMMCWVTESRTTATDEFRVLSQTDGGYRYVEMTALNYLDNPSINGIYILFHDITRSRYGKDETKRLSYTDPLTGLYNRDYYMNKLTLLDRDVLSLPLSVVLGDINGLRIINDGFGHAEGDKVIKGIAGVLKNCSRKNDVVCRIGGDEFCIFMPDTDMAAAQRICRKISNIVKNSNFSESQVIHPDISLGCMTRTDMSQSIDSVIKGADTSMYRHKLLESRTVYGSVITIIKAAMCDKKHEAQEHSERMVMLAKALGRRLGLTGELLEQVELLAMLHDVGMLSTDKKILDKQEELTDADWAEIKKHSETGCRIAKVSLQLEHIAHFILCHHERWDGSGYPAGLKGDEIPLPSRIVAVADAYDAMTHDRAYRKARTEQFAIDEIRKNAGTQFDPKVVEAFLEVISKNRNAVTEMII